MTLFWVVFGVVVFLGVLCAAGRPVDDYMDSIRERGTER